MNNFVTDRNLLVGILGLQMEFVTESQLISAMQAWIFRKADKIEDILLEQQAIKPETRDFLTGMAERHIALHHNDPAQSLASLSSLGPVRKQLRNLEDDDVSQSITRIGMMRGDQNLPDAAMIRDTVTMPANSGSVSERFQILRPHAKGGLGQVSVAEDKELHREVALKEIQPAYASDHDSRARFMMEAEVTGRLEHPGIVPVYSLGKTKTGSPFYVMRFVKGDSLKEAIDHLHSDSNRLSADDKRMTLRRLLRRLVDVCNAIEYAHSRGVLHRDLKPGNVMLGRYGETLVVDWGLAKSGSKSSAHTSSEEATFFPLSGDASTETQMGSVIGTLAYMSPEQAEGRLNELGPESDVYCLGATLYCILTGQAPIPKLPPVEMIERVRKGQVTPPRELKPEIPLALQAICQKAMACRQLDRYPTAAALANELELWLADEPVTALPEPLLDRAARFFRRHRTLVASVVAVLTTVVAALLVVNSLVRQQNKSLQIARDDANQRRAEAVEEKKKADNSRNEAIQARTRAEANLIAAAKLSLFMPTAAEQVLTKGVVNRETVLALRKWLTSEGYESFTRIYEQNPDIPEVVYGFAKVARISSNLKRLERDLKTADERIQLSLKLQLQVPEEKRTPKQKDYLAETYREIGTLRKAEGKLNEADAALTRALEHVADLIATEPDNSFYKRTKAVIEVEQIGLLSEKLELESALQKAVSSTATFQLLLSSDQAADADPIMLLLSLARQVTLLHQLRRHDEANALSLVAIAEGKKWLSQRLGDPNIALPLARIHYWTAEGIADSQGSTAEAVAQITEALVILEDLVAKSGNAGYLYGLGDALRIQGKILRLQMKYPEAEATLIKSRERLEQLVKASDTADHRDVLARSLHELATIKIAAGDKPAAIELLQQAEAMQTEACRMAPESKAMQRELELIKKELVAQLEQ